MCGRKAKHQFIDMARFRVLLRCRRTYHAVQGQCVNVGEPALPDRENCRYAVQLRGRKASGVRAVGQPDSTGESGKSRWREAERGQFLKFLLCKEISKRKHLPYTEVE